MSKSVILNISDKKSLEEKDNNICHISYQKFLEEDYLQEKIVKLKCGHTYYYDNIVESYKVTNQSGKNYMGKRICPYCRNYGGFIPFNGTSAIRGIQSWNDIQKFRNKVLEKKKKNGGLLCCSLLKTGKNKGLQCGTIISEVYQKPIYRYILSFKNNELQNFKVETKYWCGRHQKNRQLFIKNMLYLGKEGTLKFPKSYNSITQIVYRGEFGDSETKVTFTLGIIIDNKNLYNYFLSTKKDFVNLNINTIIEKLNNLDNVKDTECETVKKILNDLIYTPI